jgi:hypothetical protein
MTLSTYSERDRYAETVSRLLSEQGLIPEEEEREMTRFLRGW